MIDTILTAVVYIVYAVLAGMIPAGLVLWFAGKSGPKYTGPSAQELAARLQASEARRQELSAEIVGLRRELADAQKTNRYVLRRMYAAEGILRTQAEQAAEMEIAR